MKKLLVIGAAVIAAGAIGYTAASAGVGRPAFEIRQGSDPAFPALRISDKGAAKLDIYGSGAVEGGAAMYMPFGDIIGVRNIQGGTIGSLNLDIGAGSTQDPGDVVFNWDVGTATRVFDGHKSEIMSVNANGSGETRVHSGLSFDMEPAADVPNPVSGARLYVSDTGEVVIRYADGTEKALAFASNCSLP